MSSHTVTPFLVVLALETRANENNDFRLRGKLRSSSTPTSTSPLFIATSRYAPSSALSLHQLTRYTQDNEFNVDWFKSFDFVLNALDNLGTYTAHLQEAVANVRRYRRATTRQQDVSRRRRCAHRIRYGWIRRPSAADQKGCVRVLRLFSYAVSSIPRDTKLNFRFTAHPVPKTFAVCTIRSTPSTAHHCIAWAKSYLFPCAFRPPTASETDNLAAANSSALTMRLTDKISTMLRRTERMVSPLSLVSNALS